MIILVMYHLDSICSVTKIWSISSNLSLSRKLWLSTIERSHHKDGWPSRARLRGQVSLESNSVQTLYLPPPPQKKEKRKAFGRDKKPRSRVHTYTKRSHTHVSDPVVHIGVRWVMETLKHPAYTVGWVARLCCSWLSPRKVTRISYERNANGTI